MLTVVFHAVCSLTTYSGFGLSSPMTKDLENSYIVQQAMAAFMLKGGKTPLIDFQARFYGPVGIVMSETMTEQYLGSARISIYSAVRSLHQWLNPPCP